MEWTGVLNWVVRGGETEKGKDKMYENRKGRGWRVRRESDMVHREL